MKKPLNNMYQSYMRSELTQCRIDLEELIEKIHVTFALLELENSAVSEELLHSGRNMEMICKRLIADLQKLMRV